MKYCPCGSSKLYRKCCGKYIDLGKQPQTAEQLMRSRYSAYSQANIDYIQQTMSGPASDGFDAVQAKQWAEQAQWQGLQVLKAHNETEDKAFVTFAAHHQLNGQAQVIAERSEFHRIDGRWVYVVGEALRNAPKCADDFFAEGRKDSPPQERKF